MITMHYCTAGVFRTEYVKQPDGLYAVKAFYPDDTLAVFRKNIPEEMLDAALDEAAEHVFTQMLAPEPA